MTAGRHGHASMPPTREHTRGALRGRRRPIALACGLICLAALAFTPPAAAGPVNLSPPETPGRFGRTLFAGPGKWSPGDTTYSYAWQRCNRFGTACATVRGRGGTSYLLTTADLGSRIRTMVTARDPLLGTTSMPSPATGTIAAAPPQNTVPPAITGRTRVGSVLTARRDRWTDPSIAAVTYRRQWQRCTGREGSGCRSIHAATGTSYRARSADRRRFIRVLVLAEGLGARGVASPTVGAIAARLRKMRPFPRVIVAGRLARGLTLFSGLVVRGGPRGAMVTVRCRGRGCPRVRFRGRLSRRGALRLRRFQRTFPPRTVIEIRVTRRGTIGKFTRLRVRARRVPSRRDACLSPGSSKPRRCPAR